MTHRCQYLLQKVKIDIKHENWGQRRHDDGVLCLSVCPSSPSVFFCAYLGLGLELG